MVILGMMGTAIGALFGFIVYLFKLILAQQATRIATLESREMQSHEREVISLSTIAKNAEIAATGIAALAEGLRDIRLLLLGRSPGGD
jgi:hypothetical protein